MVPVDCPERIKSVNWTIASWVIFVLAFVWPAAFAIRRIAHRMRPRWGRCEACNYNLRGIGSDRCPECGYSILRRTPLTRKRDVLLRLMIMLILLIVAHVVNRIEAIARRGWVAAVPTTVLIALLPHQTRTGSDSGLVDQLAGEIRGRLEPQWDGSTDVNRRPTSADQPAHWQWRWMIRKSLAVDHGPAAGWSMWQWDAGRILEQAYRTDRLTVDERTRVEQMCYFDIRCRPHWPLDVDLYAHIATKCVVRGDGVRFTSRALTDGYASETITDLPGTFRTGTDSGLKRLGAADRPGDVRYEFVVERFDAASSTWRAASRETRVVTRISESNEIGLTPITIPPSVLETLSPSVGRRVGWSTENGIWLNVHPNASFGAALSTAAFAIDIQLYCDGELFASGACIWNTRSDPDSASIAGRRRPQGLFVQCREEGQMSWKQLGRLQVHSWNVVIEGDPHVALQDFDATSYWSGRYEFKDIPADATIW